MDSKQLNETFLKVQNFINKKWVYEDDVQRAFGELALELYDLHRKYNPVYSKYDIGELDDWRRIPLMPISEFKNGDVGVMPSDSMPFPGVEFQSSGTTQRDKSKHRMFDTETYRASIARALGLQIIDNVAPNYRVVLLSPSLPHSSLFYMMSYVSDLLDYRGVREQVVDFTDQQAMNEFIESLEDQDHPVILFGTSLAFYDLMENVRGKFSKVQLPTGSVLIETGGWKGRDISMSPQELTVELGEFFKLESYNLIREYSMSELSSQLYSWYNTDEPYYFAPHWLDFRLVDPLTQTEMAKGEQGIIAFVDLANVWSCPFVLTEDIGRNYTSTLGEDALILEGRAVNAPEKGCSLTYAQAQTMDH